MPLYNGLINLGGLDFVDFSIPEVVRSAGPYRFEVHKQPGGARQIDAMGDDPDPYEWEGLWLQTDAIDQMQMLQAMKTAGDPVVLTYGGIFGDEFLDNVVIESVTFDYHAPLMIAYKIKCIPITNGDNADAIGGAPDANPNIDGPA
jgi:hypothetical protein